MKTSTAQRVADNLRSRLKGGEWQVGSQLPVLDDLCEHYGTSGPTLRRAQAILRSEGWLRSEQGRGVFVESLPPAGVKSPDALVEDAADIAAQLVDITGRLRVLAQALRQEGLRP